ncbi:hypothetical protein [Pseudobacteriovorax antillogorgiicola]|uniref:Secreted protein n=1 Tax=Pseudobacteriovorax antillogorgiicola TaxID=1513793 RepID=A0A1Y6BR42_9BACT|nr:hypothetical protein [Pseudobacteriovorax antillogorgiicola]TCS54663.1 hypothetical protein EDD56_106176 [Pseudobacteriovorax antillogorgiicola]SMF16784.1 hypothetical protein SAMN06296036_10667 [Pseudobacteriovorax antillogorgiicola]
MKKVKKIIPYLPWLMIAVLLFSSRSAFHSSADSLTDVNPDELEIEDADGKIQKAGYEPNTDIDSQWESMDTTKLP